MAKQKGKAGTLTESNGKKPSRSRNRNQVAKDNNALFKLLDQGYKIIKMDADGNCLFRALSDQLFGDGGARHEEVRRAVCDYIADRKEDFEPFLLGDDDDEDVMDIDVYIETMMEDGSYGGDVELNAASKLYRRNIKIYSEKYGVCPPIECENAEGDFVLSYRQMRCGDNHYNSAFRPAKDAAVDELMLRWIWIPMHSRRCCSLV